MAQVRYKKKPPFGDLIFKLVTRTGFEPMNACVKGMCVKPLHQRAKMVDLNGLEPSTSRLSGVRSNQLSYRSVSFDYIIISNILLFCQQ